MSVAPSVTKVQNLEEPPLPRIRVNCGDEKRRGEENLRGGKGEQKEAKHLNY